METGRIALVTGGGSGIGLAVARALHGRGWSVAVCGRDERKLASARSTLGPERVLAVAADVGREEDVRRLVAETVAALGPPELLVNNAAIALHGEVAGTSAEDWRRVLDVNLTGAFLCTREVLPHMRGRGGGYVVNVSSVAGKTGLPGSGAYGASKFGLMGLTETIAREEKAHGIRATAICPGMVATDMAWPAGTATEEMIQPEDVAATVLYLLDLSPVCAVPEIVIRRLAALS